VPYLEVFLRDRRPVLVRQATKFKREPAHRRLWVNTFGAPMEEAALRELIKTHTRRQFGNAVWPHLFRDCLLTSLAIDQPELMKIGATLLGHASSTTGEQHYKKARMVDASRRYGEAISEMRQSFLGDISSRG
jgi:integrase/recombinase XerD